MLNVYAEQLTDEAIDSITGVYNDAYSELSRYLSEVLDYNKFGGYSSLDLYNSNRVIKRAVDDLVNGFIPNVYFEGKDVFNEILNNDVYYVTKDLPMYLDSMNRIDEDWKNPYVWRKKAIINIANSGFFDIVRNIEDYCNKVWFI